MSLIFVVKFVFIGILEVVFVFLVVICLELKIIGFDNFIVVLIGEVELIDWFVVIFLIFFLSILLLFDNVFLFLIFVLNDIVLVFVVLVLFVLLIVFIVVFEFLIMFLFVLIEVLKFLDILLMELDDDFLI